MDLEWGVCPDPAEEAEPHEEYRGKPGPGRRGDRDPGMAGVARLRRPARRRRRPRGRAAAPARISFAAERLPAAVYGEHALRQQHPAAQQPAFPGNQALERRIKSLVRWNALSMVVRANKLSDGIGGHISTFASAATLYEVGFNHFFKGTGPGLRRRRDLLPGPRGARHLRARVSRRPAVGRRSSRTSAARRRPGGGLSSYPHPWLMPDFWEYPTVSMGLGPDHGDLPGALHAPPGRSRPGAARAIARCGRFSATARPTSPSRSARSRWPRARSSTT